MQPEMQQTTMRDYLKVLFSQKAVIFITIMTVMITVFIGLKLKTPVYKSKVTMLVSAEKQLQAPYYRELMGGRGAPVVFTQMEIVKTDPVMERVVNALDLDARPLDYERGFASEIKKPLIDRQVAGLEERLEEMPDQQRNFFLFRRAISELKKNTTVDPIRDTNLFTVTVSEYSPIGAAITANVLSRSHVIFDLEQQLAEMRLKYGERHQSVQEMSSTIQNMQASLTGAPLTNIEAIGPASVKIVEQAQVPTSPEGLSDTVVIALALFLAVFLSAMLAFMFEYLDHTIKSPEDVEKTLEISVLGSVPKKKKLKKRYLRELSDKLYLTMKKESMQSVLVTSAFQGEGTENLTANMARTFSEIHNRKVLIIDANVRQPVMHKAFNTEETPGLAEVLESKIFLGDAVKKVTPPRKRGKRSSGEESQMFLLPAGRTKVNPITLLDSSTMKEVLEKSKEKYDFVFVTPSNLKDHKDGLALAEYTDSASIVIDCGKSRRLAVKSVIEPLKEKNVKILGAILNNRKFAIPNFIYNRM